jgi:hypothetical protein
VGLVIINLHFFGGGGGPSRYYEQNNPTPILAFDPINREGTQPGPSQYYEQNNPTPILAFDPINREGTQPGPSQYYEQNNPQNRRVRQLPTDGSMGIAGGWEPIPTPVIGASRAFENANRVPGGILDQIDISNPGWREEADKYYVQIPEQPGQGGVGISRPAGPNPRLDNTREAYQHILPVGNPTPLPQENVISIEPWQRRNPNDIVSNGKGGSQYPQPYNRIQDPYRRIAGNGK